MTKEDLNWLDDIVEKIYNDEEIATEEINKLLNYTTVPAALKRLLGYDTLKYIDLVDNYHLLDELPDNPLDAGGKEYLKNSIDTANQLYNDRQLDRDKRQHLVRELTAPLELIYHGKDDPEFKSILKTITREPNEDTKKYLSEKRISELIGEDFKELFFTVVRNRATDTFIEMLDKTLKSKGLLKEEDAITLNFKGYPEKSLIHTTMLSRDLPLLMEKDTEERQLSLFHIDVPVRRNERDKRIAGTITIDDIIEKDNNISFFDMFHYLGVCRLYNNGDTSFTPDMLVRAAYSDSKKRVTEKQRNEAMKSIDKMMRTVLDIDVSEEYRLYRKIGNDEELTLGENMIYARRAKLKHSNGTISAGYELLRQPILDVHAFNLSQIDHLENEIMEVSGGKDDALLITYLGSRLATIKNSKNRMGNRILLETIYKHMDLENPNRQKRAQIKDKIESRLNEWENKGVIKSSKFIKEKGKYHAVEIIA